MSDPTVWAVAAVVVVLAAVFFGRGRLATWWASRRGMAAIDRMDGAAFERYLVKLFKGLGYEVEHVGSRNDYGADLLVTKDGSRTAVQAKARTNYVPISAVQQVLGARFYYDCGEALVVTNRYYSKPAQRLAGKAGVALWDRDRLIALTAAQAHGGRAVENPSARRDEPPKAGGKAVRVKRSQRRDHVG